LTAEEAPGDRAEPGASGEAPEAAAKQARAGRRPGRPVWVVAGIAVTAGLLLAPSLFSGAFADKSGPTAGPAAGHAADDTLNDPDPVNSPNQAPLPMNAPSLGAQGPEPTPASTPPSTSKAPAKRPAGSQQGQSAGQQGQSAGQQAAPQPAAHSAAPQTTHASTPAPRPVVMFRAVGGEDCTHTSSQGYYRIGTYSDGAAGWYRKGGGWAGNGCHGTFMAMPMSGNRSFDDPAAYAVWWFNTGAVHSGTCAVSVYVPNSGTARDVAGHPATYQVVRGAYNMGLVRSFTVDQTAHRGQWVGVGKYPLSNGQFALRVVNRGEDPHGEHIGVGQVALTCAGY
jgi:hypothetical protein